MDKRELSLRWVRDAGERAAAFKQGVATDGHHQVVIPQGDLAVLTALARSARYSSLFGYQGIDLVERALDRALSLLTGDTENAVVQTIVEDDEWHRLYSEAE